MPSCVVPTCKHATGITKKLHGITFHTFPVDEVRKSEWTKIIRRARLDDLWKPSKKSLICSIHFEEQYLYETPGGYKRLYKKAVPNRKMNLPPETSETPVGISVPLVLKSEPTGSNTVIDNVNNLDLVPEKYNASVGISGLLIPKTEFQDTQPELPTGSNSSIGDVSVLESPREIILKVQLRRKQMFCKRYVRKIKTLQQKIKRLAKRNESLKSIIRNLKNNR
ncbi:THAP domain-containing protein 2-like [Ostrinia furnacalis]|uniref:THAP domain-containing protein 2-like n=1 Tax=Ostrinia furnacalis TaxID=93504 RepID=UPI00103942D7|nr:THAP domain-containing protein 2-like [Ostrinia furnacalis]